MTALPPQDELRRRLRAARVLADLTLDELAARLSPDVGLSQRTLRKLEGGEAPIREPALRTLAPALGLPYEFFTIERIADAFTPPDDWQARIEALEAWRAQADPGVNSTRVDLPSREAAQPSPGRRGPRGTRQSRSR